MQLCLSLKIQTEASLNGPPLDLRPSACLQPEYKFSTVVSAVTMAPLQRERRPKWEPEEAPPACSARPFSSFPRIWFRNKEPKEKEDVFSKLSAAPPTPSRAPKGLSLPPPAFVRRQL